MTRQRKLLFAALFAVYVIWGSTYLAIRIGIETMPPWLVAALRNLLGGLIMLGISRLAKELPLTRAQKSVAIVSGALLIFANGVVGVAELWVPSGVAAVIIGAMPVWIMLFGWLIFSTGRPTLRRFAGALIGLAGIAVISLADSGPLHSENAKFGIAILFASSWIWAVGTLFQKKATGVRSAFAFSSLQLLTGGSVVALVSLVFEKPWAIPIESVSSNSIFAVLYLAIFGSVIAFTAFSWLGRNADPHLVSTYALVNPLIAVALGWAFAGEVVTTRFALATALVVGGIAVMMLPPKKPLPTAAIPAA